MFIPSKSFKEFDKFFFKLFVIHKTPVYAISFKCTLTYVKRIKTLNFYRS